MTAPENLLGAVLEGRYELSALVGEGGMGVVYRGHDRSSQRAVAVKFLHDDGGADVARFIREAEVLANLEHPSIVRYISHGRADWGAHYLAMEWLEGEDLDTHLQSGLMSIQDAVTLTIRIADALEHAHARGVLHRDIKPANIFLQEKSFERAKILDFGVARQTGRPKYTKTGLMVGTPGYMAPEQARPGVELDARADVFALGCVLYECLRGQPAFPGDNVMAVLAKVLVAEVDLRDLAPVVPPELIALVERMLKKDPSARTESAKQVASELRHIARTGLADPSPIPRSPSRTHRVLSGRERRFFWVVFGALPMGKSEMAANWPAAAQAELREAVAEFGADLELLTDGSVVARIETIGAPADQAAKAARCALALRKLLPRYAIAVAAGLGEATDRLPVGNAIDRVTTLIDPAAAPSDSILVDDTTAAFLEGRFEIARVGRLHIISAALESDTSRQVLGKIIPCVGRERELDVLYGLWHEVHDEHVPRVALVTGPAGVGKSRLKHELLQRVLVRTAEVRVVIGTGSPVGQPAPFAVLRQAVRSAFGIATGADASGISRRLSERISSRVAPADAERVRTFIGELIGVPSEHESVELRAARANAHLMNDQLRRAWREWVAAECAAQPLLIVLEDLQWCDRPTVEYVEEALRCAEGHSLMVVALARPEVQEVFPRLWEPQDVQHMRLGPLKRSAGEQLLRHMLGPEVAPDVLERLLGHSQGNPFFLEELARAFDAGKGANLPTTVLATVNVRVQRMDSELRRIVRAASVFGDVFWDGGVRALLGPDALTESEVEHLVRQELVTRSPSSRFDGEREYAFRHNLVHEASYEMLTAEDRKLGHRLAAKWLEEKGDSAAYILGEHFSRGEDWEKAAFWFSKAAEESLLANDIASAIVAADRGLERGATDAIFGVLHVVKAEAHAWRGEWAITLASLTLILARPTVPTVFRIRGIGLLMGMKAALGDEDAVASLVSELVGIVPDDENAETLLRAFALALLCTTINRSLQAVPVLRTIRILAAPRAADPHFAAWGAQADRFVESYSNDGQWNFDLWTMAAELLEKEGDMRRSAIAIVNAGVAAFGLRHYEVAIAYAERGLSMGERLSANHTIGVALISLSRALVATGDATRALGLAERAERLFLVQGNRRYVDTAREIIADARGLVGD